jgi:hypothetical protein
MCSTFFDAPCAASDDGTHAFTPIEWRGIFRWFCDHCGLEIGGCWRECEPGLKKYGMPAYEPYFWE